MGILGSLLIFTLACNLDTLVLAIGFGQRGVRPTGRGCLLLGAVTSLITGVALALGQGAGGLIDPAAARQGGGLVLMAVGAWMLLDWLKTPGKTEELPSLGEGYLPLAAALGFNNGGAGLAAGVAGLPCLWGAAVNLAVTLLLLPLGLSVGRRLKGSRWGRLAAPLSGGLLLLLGGTQLLL